MHLHEGMIVLQLPNVLIQMLMQYFSACSNRFCSMKAAPLTGPSGCVMLPGLRGPCCPVSIKGNTVRVGAGGL